MSPEIKDILLVCLGSLASLLGSLIAFILQNRHERYLRRLERQQKHFDEIQEYFYAYARLYAHIINFLTEVHLRRDLSTEQKMELFNRRITNELSRVTESRFNGLPVLFFTRDKKLIDEIAQVIDDFLKVKVLILLIQQGKTDMSEDQIKSEVQHLETMNEHVDSILRQLEPRSYS